MNDATLPGSETFVVVGMTCDHCVAAVTEEVTAISGVAQVDVDLATGRLTVTSFQQLDQLQVRTAVEEAGYHLAAAGS